jgi:hypothetical protein
MSFTLVLAILGGISVFAAALKGIPIIWNAAKSAGKFIGALEDVPDIEKLESNQEELKESLNSINDTLRRVEDDAREMGNIRTLANEFNSTISKISDNTIDLTVTAFKSHATHCDVPSYIIASSDGKVGNFIWANDPWYELHGIGYTEAKNGQFWDSIAEEDRQRVKHASDAAALSKIEYKVTYHIINPETQVRTKVTANSWPLIPYNAYVDNRVVYLGGIEIN